MMDFYMVKEIISDYINVVVEKTFVIAVISSRIVASGNFHVLCRFLFYRRKHSGTGICGSYSIYGIF